jgi:hypothetical protein
MPCTRNSQPLLAGTSRRELPAVAQIRETHDYSKKRQSGQTLAPQAAASDGA